MRRNIGGTNLRRMLSKVPKNRNYKRKNCKRLECRPSESNIVNFTAESNIEIV